MLEVDRIYLMEVREGLSKLPDESIDCVVTSPPYWGLRDYGASTAAVWGGDPGCSHEFDIPIVRKRNNGTASAVVGSNRQGVGSYVNHSSVCTRCGAWRGQLGMESNFNDYIDHLLEIFDEVRRVLTPGGTCWVNLGDGYGGSLPGVSYAAKSKGKTSILRGGVEHYAARGHQRGRWDKCLLGIPERFMLGMLERGWTLRNKIVWHKPNRTPSSVKDRFTNGWEYLFFFAKSKHYSFDLDAVREPHKRGTPQAERNYQRMMAGRARFGGKHALHGKKPAFSSGHPKGKNPGDCWDIHTKPFRGAHFAVFPEKLIERPIKAGCPPGGVVLDLFMGSGTTAIVAKRLGRRFIGFELNPEYVAMANQRLKESKDENSSGGAVV